MVAVPAIAACSILGGDFGEYSTEDPSDAGPSTSTDTTPAGDSSPPTTSDAAKDAPADGGAPFCVPGAHAFCADFEDPSALSMFTNQDVAPSGLLEINATRATSGTKSLFTSLPKRDTGILAALVKKQLPGDWRRTVVELDMFIEPIVWQSSDVNASFLEMGYYSSTLSHTFFVVIGPDYTALSGGNVPDTSSSVVETGKWLHVRAELTTSAFVVTIDGISSTHVFSISQGGSAPRFQLGVGINGFNVPVPRFGASYDNVSIDFP